MKRAFASDEVKDYFIKSGLMPMNFRVDEMNRMQEVESAKVKKMVVEAGVKPA
jgi:tripartite-type tricarboxylate transporter receptor subunit TctC